MPSNRTRKSKRGVPAKRHSKRKIRVNPVKDKLGKEIDLFWETSKQDGKRQIRVRRRIHLEVVRREANGRVDLIDRKLKIAGRLLLIVVILLQVLRTILEANLK